jgi:hypothetical protein
VNLTENLGFGERATHTARAPKHIKPTLDIDFPLSHPSVVLDEIANRWTQRHVHGAGVGSGLNLLVKYAKLSLQKSAHAALIPIRSGKDSV